MSSFKSEADFLIGSENPKYQVESTIKAMQKKLRFACFAHYLAEAQYMPDYVYDRELEELRKLEEENPDVDTTNSPTKLYGPVAARKAMEIDDIDSAWLGRVYLRNNTHINSWIEKYGLLQTILMFSDSEIQDVEISKLWDEVRQSISALEKCLRSKNIAYKKNPSITVEEDKKTLIECLREQNIKDKL